MKKFILLFLTALMVISPSLTFASQSTEVAKTNGVDQSQRTVTTERVEAEGEVFEITIIETPAFKKVTAVNGDEVNESVYNKANGTLKLNGELLDQATVDGFKDITEGLELDAEAQGASNLDDGGFTTMEIPVQCCGTGFTKIGASSGNVNLTALTTGAIYTVLLGLFVANPPLSILLGLIVTIKGSINDKADRYLYYRTMHYKGPHPSFPNIITTTFRHIYFYKYSNFSGYIGNFAWY